MAFLSSSIGDTKLALTITTFIVLKKNLPFKQSYGT